MSSVDSIIQSNDIVVFSSGGCPYCRDAINSLQATGKKFEVIEANSEQRSQLYGKTNVSSVPNIWVKGKFVGGKIIVNYNNKSSLNDDAICLCTL